MAQYKLLTLAGLLALFAADPTIAQGQGNRAVVFSAQGGGFNPLTNLEEADNVDFKTGFNIGGGIAYQFNRYLAARGNFTFARAEAQDKGIVTAGSVGGTKFNRFFYGADLQLRYPLRGGATPYAFVGGGGVTVEQDVTPDQPSFTKGAGKVGVGLSYPIPRSNVGLYAEGTGWIYKWDRNGFDKTQFDTTWSSGIAYHFGI